MLIFFPKTKMYILIGKVCHTVISGKPETSQIVTGIKMPERHEHEIREVWLNYVVVALLGHLRIDREAGGNGWTLITKDHWQAKIIFSVEAGRSSMKNGWAELINTLK